MVIHVEFIREIMKIRRKSISQLAKECNMSERTLKNLLYGESEDPRISTLYTIASNLGASIDRLVGLAPPRDFHEEERAYDANLMETMQDRVKLQEGQLKLQEEQLAEKNAAIDSLKQRVHELEVLAGSQEARLESKASSIQHRDSIIRDQTTTIKSQQRTVAICIVVMLLLAIAVTYGIWEIINIDRGVSSLLHSDTLH